MADLAVKAVAGADAGLLAACAALSASCFPDQPAQQWRADQLGAHLAQNDNALFVALAGDELAAFALFAIVEGEGELLSICVAPTHRRHGCGASLLRHAMQALKPQKILLEVAADNQAAIGLYVGVGFRQIDRRKAYYTGQNGGKMDALIMALSYP